MLVLFCIFFSVWYIFYLISYNDRSYVSTRAIASEYNKKFLSQSGGNQFEPNASTPFCSKEATEKILSSRVVAANASCAIVHAAPAHQHCNFWWLGRRCYALYTRSNIYADEKIKYFLKSFTANLCSEEQVPYYANETLRKLCNSPFEHIMPFDLRLVVEDVNSVGVYTGYKVLQLR
ncbi:MAG: hypothetical protein WDZ84_08435 [Rhodovibrionaceae bacterium]